MPVTADDAVKADQRGAVAEEFEKYRLKTSPNPFVAFDAFHAFILSPNFGKSI